MEIYHLRVINKVTEMEACYTPIKIVLLPAEITLLITININLSFLQDFNRKIEEGKALKMQTLTIMEVQTIMEMEI